MSNRILSILILLGFVIGGYIYYNYSYLPKLDQERLLLIKKQIEKDNKEKIKKIELVKVDKEIRTLSNNKKIEELINNEKNYKTFILNNGLTAYFKKNNNKLELFYNNKKLGIFDLVPVYDLRLNMILGKSNDLYFEIANNKYYYNDITKNIKKINLNIDVLYIKNGINKNLIIVTKKGSFIYNTLNNSLNYFSYFNDFVYFKEGYIGLVKFNDYRILNNLGIDSNDKNRIIYYNFITKEKKVLKSTLIDINKIYIENNNLFLETKDKEVYKLNNI